MSYSEEKTEEFHYFSEVEHKFIQSWLKKHGYEWRQNAVCGNCCGMYADEYWVNGIWGKFKKEDQETFLKAMEKKGYECSVEGNTISAEPK